MKHSPSLEADSHSSSEEIPHLLWNQNIHYRAQKSLPLAPILSQMNPVHNPPTYSPRPILILSTHLHGGLPSGLLYSVFPTKIWYKISYLPYGCYMTRPSSPQ